jgi:hypothetical protein
LRPFEAKRRGGKRKRILKWIAVGMSALSMLVVFGIALLLRSERFVPICCELPARKATEAALGSQNGYETSLFICQYQPYD